MRFIRRSELDKDRWDALVEQHHADVFSYSWYLDACAHDWCVLADERMENGIALAFTTRLGVQMLTPPIFVRNLDLIGNDAGFAARAMPLIAEMFGAGHMQVSVPVALPLPALPKGKIHTASRTFQAIDRGAEVRINQQASRMLKKAVKAGYSVQSTGDWRGVLEVIRRELPGKITEFTPENLGRLEKLVASLEKEEKLSCFGIYKDNVLQGGMIYMDSADKRIYLKGAANREARDAGGMYLGMQGAIEEALLKGKAFDFGGSEVEGVRRFNHNLGGTDRSYYIYTWDRSPGWFRLIKTIYRKWKKK